MTMTTNHDVNGVTGSLLHYSLVLFFVIGAFFVLIYLWKKGRLDLDEEPKFQMMRESELIDKEEQNVRK